MLSIVIPNYNNGTYLKKCLESLKCQTSDDFEAIIVDDCSTDDSVRIISEFYDSNSNLKIKLLLNDTNKGPGLTRNKGLENISGEYFTFIDSDDEVSCDFVERLISMSETGEDIILFSVNKCVGSSKSLIRPVDGGQVNNIRDLFVCASHNIYGKIYKVSKMRDIRFNKSPLGEDFVFTRKAIFCSETYKIVDAEGLYFYNMDNSSSIIHQKRQDRDYAYENYCELSKFCKGYEEELAALYTVSVVYSNVIFGIRNGKSLKAIYKTYKEDCLQINYMKNRYYKMLPERLRKVLFCVRFRLLFIIKMAYSFGVGRI